MGKRDWLVPLLLALGVVAASARPHHRRGGFRGPGWGWRGGHHHWRSVHFDYYPYGYGYHRGYYPHRTYAPVVPRLEAFGQLDRDGNGYLSLGELQHLASTSGFLGGNRDELWVRLARVFDVDGDGSASLPEQDRGAQQVLARLDRNGDQYLTRYEFSALAHDLDWLRSELRLGAASTPVLAPVPVPSTPQVQQVPAPPTGTTVVPRAVPPGNQPPAPPVRAAVPVPPPGTSVQATQPPPVPASVAPAAPTAPAAASAPPVRPGSPARPRPLDGVPKSRYDLNGDGRVTGEELENLRSQARTLGGDGD